MSLTNSVRELVSACFTGIWIESHEHQDAIGELAMLCAEEDWNLTLWDIDQGLHRFAAAAADHDGEVDVSDPLAAVRSLRTMASHDSTTLLVLQNFHRFLGSPEIVQAVYQAVMDGKATRSIVVILSPLVQLPAELEKLFVTLEHPRPQRGQLEEIARGVATETGELPGGGELASVLDAAAGLTRYEAENAYALSLVRHGRLAPSAIWEIKTQTLKKSGTLSLHRGEEDFASLGGLSALKAFTKRALLRRADPARVRVPITRTVTSTFVPHVRARGVMLLSPPGCGKSAFCKSLGKEVGRPVLILDVGSLMGSLVGQSEQRTRQALATIDAMAPAIVMLDEVEKAFAGASGGGQNDSGVSSRMFGTFLQWLNDHDSDVFVVCTANDVAKLPPEFARAERFDAVFFVDLPGREQKDAIWQLYLEQFAVDGEQTRPEDDQWSGAEIKSCCRLAALLDLPLVQAAQNVVPVAVTAAESVERLRSWADGRCLSADSPGVYRATKRRSRSRRPVATDPSRN